MTPQRAEVAATEVSALAPSELLARAAARRDAAFGTRVTFSPKVFIPLTQLCRDGCQYCTFAQPPKRLQAPFLSPEQVLEIAVAGATAGCHEALFTLGEAPETKWEVAREWLAAARPRDDDRLPGRDVRAGADRDRPAPPRQRRRDL